MEVIWHRKAFTSLDKNIDYLKKVWSQNEVVQFLDKVENAIQVIIENPNIGLVYEELPILRKLLITKEIYLFYEVDNQKLYIVLFWNNYQDPESLQVLLP